MYLIKIQQKLLQFNIIVFIFIIFLIVINFCFEGSINDTDTILHIKISS